MILQETIDIQNLFQNEGRDSFLGPLVEPTAKNKTKQLNVLERNKAESI